MVRRECTIQDFRNIVAKAADILNMKRQHFNLVMEINGDPSIIDAYGLEIYDGKKWMKLHRGNDICQVIDIIRESMKAELKKEEKK